MAAARTHPYLKHVKNGNGLMWHGKWFRDKNKGMPRMPSLKSSNRKARNNAGFTGLWLTVGD
jgi:hypothetical protein